MVDDKDRPMRKRLRPAAAESLSLLQRETPSLADKLQDLGVDSTSEFAQRLQRQSEPQASSCPTPSSANTWRLFDYWEISPLLLVIAAAICISPATTLADWSTAWSSVTQLLWLPWWKHKEWGTSLLLMTHVVQQEQVWTFVRETWPTVQSTFSKVVKAELWNRFWSVTWKQAGRLWSAKNASREKNHSGPRVEVPPWMTKSHSFLVTAVEKAARKAFQVVIQKRLESTFWDLLELAGDSVRDVL